MPTTNEIRESMKHIYIFLCLFLLSGVVHADKWLCGTSSKMPARGFSCGVDWEENFGKRRYRQYLFILDEIVNNEDGLSRVMFREVDGNVVFNGDVCMDSTETELGCYNDSHYFSFYRKYHDFHYRRNPHTKDSFRASGICTPFENQVANSYFDFTGAMQFKMTQRVGEALQDNFPSWYDRHLASKRKDL